MKEYKLAYRPIEMGCIARVTGHSKGCNEGRIVRVLLPLQPGERYGHAQRKAPQNPKNTYWQIAALDGGLLEYTMGTSIEVQQDVTVAMRTKRLRRLKEVEG